jgi:hypothetical protein
MSSGIEPRPVVKASALDDERISFPMTDGISHEAWGGVFRETPSIQEDLTIGEVLEEDND